LGVSIEADRDGQVRVMRVHRGSPAEQMGLEQGDRITHLNGRPVESTGQFISQIRNMEPGAEVEIEVRRDSQDRTFRGELESREQALVLRGGRIRGQYDWQQGRDTWQTGYEEQRDFSQDPYGRGGDVNRQISQIERQLNQLSRQIEELRFAVREIREQSGRWGRETTARYDEYRDREGRGDRDRMSGRWQDDDRQFDGARDRQRFDQQDSQRPFESGRQFDRQGGQGSSRSGSQSGPRSRQYDEGTRSQDSAEDQSIGGEFGEERTRTGSEIHDRN
jgi:hypothetical protein